MTEKLIEHAPRHFHFTLARRLEIESELAHAPVELDRHESRCPHCGCLMMYRGKGRLSNGTLVHYFECVHSPREVHSLSLVIHE